MGRCAGRADPSSKSWEIEEAQHFVKDITQNCIEKNRKPRRRSGYKAWWHEGFLSELVDQKAYWWPGQSALDKAAGQAAKKTDPVWQLEPGGRIWQHQNPALRHVLSLEVSGRQGQVCLWWWRWWGPGEHRQQTLHGLKGGGRKDRAGQAGAAQARLGNARILR